MWLKFGVSADNTWISIEEVSRGKTALTCLYCGGQLTAKKGEIKEPHFAHTETSCKPVANRIANRGFPSLPLYDKFNIELSGKELEELKVFWQNYGALNEGIFVKPSLRLILSKLLTWNEGGFYEFTDLGRIPVGALPCYFNIEIQKWQKFFDFIAQEAQTVLLKTDSNRLVDVLIKHFPPDDMESWGATLVLGKISDGNSTGIDTLIELLTSHKFLTRYEAAYALARIGTGNQEIINRLKNLLNSTQDKEIRLFVAWTLGKVELKNQDALKVLTELLHTSEDDETRLRVAEKLGEIDPENTDAIRTLVKFNSLQTDWKLYEQAKKILRNIGATNPIAIAALNEMSPIIKHRNQQVSDGLLEYLGTSQSELDRIKAAIKQLCDINALVELLYTGYGDLFEFRIRGMVVRRLREIASDHPTPLQTLIKLLYASQYEKIYSSVVSILGEVAVGDWNAVNALIYLLQTSKDTSTHDAVTYNLKRIVQGNLFTTVVSGLIDCLTDQVKEDDFLRYNYCYEVIWHCAQNMIYPAFHKAWHQHQQEEVGNTTTPNSSSLNQADLPQSLPSAIANDPQLSQTIHLICINGSNFIDPNNPVAEIYDQMLDQNCPECGTVPETMPALKLYWNSLKRKSDKRVVLVFYASSTDTTSAKDTALPCPYSETFLSDLSKFGDRICVVTNQPIDPISLQFFAPSQSIADVLQWIRAIATEQ